MSCQCIRIRANISEQLYLIWVDEDHSPHTSHIYIDHHILIIKQLIIYAIPVYQIPIQNNDTCHTSVPDSDPK